MFPAFLPSQVNQLTEEASLALVRMIQQQAIATPLQADPILTTYLHQGTVSQGAGGTPLLLLPGFDSSLLEFRRLLPRLAEQTEAWAVDLLGFGFTERPPGLSYSPAQIKTHLYYFWQQMIQRPMLLVGASMGGAAALDFALTYPEAVAQLVLIDSSGFAPSPKASQWIVPPLDRWATAFLASPRVRRWVSRQAYCDRSFVTADAECCAALHLQDPNWSSALIAFTKSGGYNFLYDSIREISQPTLILWGEQDKIMNRRDARKFAGAIAQNQLIWISDCGHVPHLEQAALTARYILEFQTAHLHRPEALKDPSVAVIKPKP